MFPVTGADRAYSPICLFIMTLFIVLIFFYFCSIKNWALKMITAILIWALIIWGCCKEAKDNPSGPGFPC